jgi:hypothetical protein
MRKVQFYLCAAVAMSMAAIGSVGSADDTSDAKSIANETELQAVYAGGNMGTVIKEYNASYSSWTSTYDDNVSEWSYWSSFATSTEKSTISSLLSDQSTRLGNVNAEISYMKYYANDAPGEWLQYKNYIRYASGNNSAAVYALGYIEAWEDDIDAFSEAADNASYYIGIISSDQSTFDSILNDIKNRQGG